MVLVFALRFWLSARRESQKEKPKTRRPRVFRATRFRFRFWLWPPRSRPHSPWAGSARTPFWRRSRRESTASSLACSSCTPCSWRMTTVVRTTAMRQRASCLQRQTHMGSRESHSSGRCRAFRLAHAGSRSAGSWKSGARQPEAARTPFGSRCPSCSCRARPPVWDP